MQLPKCSSVQVYKSARQGCAAERGSDASLLQSFKIPFFNFQNSLPNHPVGNPKETRPNCARKVREMILFNVLCTVYCGRGCMTLESE